MQITTGKNIGKSIMLDQKNIFKTLLVSCWFSVFYLTNDGTDLQETYYVDCMLLMYNSVYTIIKHASHEGLGHLSIITSDIVMQELLKKEINW